MKAKALVLTTPIALILLTGCGPQLDPCRDVAVENQAELAEFASDNPQIEIEAEGYGETECVLTGGGNWVDEAQLEDDEDD